MKHLKTITLLITITLLSISLISCGPPPDQPQQSGGAEQPAQQPRDAEQPTEQAKEAEQPAEQAEHAEEPVEQAAPKTDTETSSSLTIKGEVWVDNWFAFYLGETLVKEDSVSITTERSFNAETFTFNGSYPLVLNFIVKDFKENDTGLEYIGARNQQMGDGGFIAQFTDTNTGQVIAVTDSNWKCLVIHEAPLDKSCEKESNPVAGQGPCGFNALDEPTGWKTAAFDDSAWTNASTYTENQVGPKDGYDQISWNSAANLIWTSDLETHNTLLCRLKVESP